MPNCTVYCKVCEREVVLKKKNFAHRYHELLIILTICTLGVGYLILRAFKQKNTCPHCESVFDLNNLDAYKIPEGRTAKLKSS